MIQAAVRSRSSITQRTRLSATAMEYIQKPSAMMNMVTIMMAGHRRFLTDTNRGALVKGVPPFN